MKTLNKLEAFKLKKKQMHSLMGGETRCTVDFGEGVIITLTSHDMTSDEAKKSLEKAYNTADIDCTEA